MAAAANFLKSSINFVSRNPISSAGIVGLGMLIGYNRFGSNNSSAGSYIGSGSGSGKIGRAVKVYPNPTLFIEKGGAFETYLNQLNAFVKKEEKGKSLALKDPKLLDLALLKNARAYRNNHEVSIAPKTVSPFLTQNKGFIKGIIDKRRSKVQELEWGAKQQLTKVFKYTETQIIKQIGTYAAKAKLTDDEATNLENETVDFYASIRTYGSNYHVVGGVCNHVKSHFPIYRKSKVPEYFGSSRAETNPALGRALDKKNKTALPQCLTLLKTGRVALLAKFKEVKTKEETLKIALSDSLKTQALKLVQTARQTFKALQPKPNTKPQTNTNEDKKKKKNV